jgi:hypothetical protein
MTWSCWFRSSTSSLSVSSYAAAFFATGVTTVVGFCISCDLQPHHHPDTRSQK